jgi:hypothetical protein
MVQGRRRRSDAGVFDPADPSIYMLGVPKSRPKLGNWLVFTVLAGAALALVLFGIETLIF